MAIDHAFEDIAQIGEGLDAVHLGGLDERTDHGPAAAVAAAVRTGEQVVLAAQGNGPDRALDGIVVQIDTAVREEQAKRLPAAQGVADGLGQGSALRRAGQLTFGPSMKFVGQRLSITI